MIKQITEQIDIKLLDADLINLLHTGCYLNRSDWENCKTISVYTDYSRIHEPGFAPTHNIRLTRIKD